MGIRQGQVCAKVLPNEVCEFQNMASKLSETCKHIS